MTRNFTTLFCTFMATGCTFAQKVTAVVQEAKIEESNADLASLQGFEDILSKNGVENLDAFLSSEQTKNQYFDYAQKYYGPNHFSSRACFDKILEDVAAIVKQESGASSAENKTAQTFARQIWEPRDTSGSFSLPASQIDYGIVNLPKNELLKLQTKIYLGYVEQTKNILDLGVQQEALKRSVQKLQAQLLAELGQTSNGQNLADAVLASPKARAIAAAIAAIAYQRNAVSRNQATDSANLFLNLWRTLREDFASTADLFEVSFPGLDALGTELVPSVSEFAKQNPIFKKKDQLSEEAFSELLKVEDARIHMIVPKRRLHALFKYSSGYNCENQTPYAYTTMLFDDSITYFAEQSKVFRGSVDLFPLEYKWRKQNLEEFGGRYVIYSPAFLGNIFSETALIETKPGTSSVASVLKMWAAAFAERLPRNAIGVGIDGAQFFSEDGFYQHYLNYIGGYTAQIIGKRSDLALTASGTEMMLHLVKRRDPSQDRFNVRMVPDLTMLTRLILSNSSEFSLFPSAPMEQVVRQEMLNESSMNFGSRGCPIPADMFKFIDFNRAAEMELFLNCLENNSSLHDATQGTLSTMSNEFLTLSRVVTELANSAKDLSPEAIQVLKQHSQFYTKFEKVLDRLEQSRSGKATVISVNQAWVDFTLNMGRLLVTHLDAAPASQIGEKLSQSMKTVIPGSHQAANAKIVIEIYGKRLSELEEDLLRRRVETKLKEIMAQQR